MLGKPQPQVEVLGGGNLRAIAANALEGSAAHDHGGVRGNTTEISGRIADHALFRRHLECQRCQLHRGLRGPQASFWNGSAAAWPPAMEIFKCGSGAYAKAARRRHWWLSAPPRSSDSS
jgi:hypothetical protein